MSKHISAIGRVGIATSENVAQASLSGNGLALRRAQIVLENEFLDPMGRGRDALLELAELLKVVHDLATQPLNESNPDEHKARITLCRIRRLTDMGAYYAADLANHLDCANETARDEHVPALLAALRGAA